MHFYELGSEHYLNDEKFPLELHVVHKSNSGNLAVLGFLFQVILYFFKRFLKRF
jgi:carbonic anhydrase